MSMRYSFQSIILALFFTVLTACTSLANKLDEVNEPSEKTDYKKSQTLPKLEIPPDLTSSSIDDSLAVPDIDPAGTATLSAYEGERGNVQRTTDNVLPQQDDIRIERDGDKRWLVVRGDPEQVYPKVREFWVQKGFLLKREDPRIGIMETDWLENRADIPQDIIRSTISKVFESIYSAATRDKFRVRLERGKEEGTTEVYISHQGVEEVVKGDSTVFQPRPSDPELEAEMLNRLVVYFGVDEEKAKTLLAEEESQAPRAQLTRDGDGNAFLSLEEDFSRAWRRTGLALDRVGFTVEDRDRSRGLYFVRYIDPLKDEKKKGFLSNLKFWGDDDKPDSNQYLVSVVGEEANSRIVVLNQDGAPEQSDTSDRILTLLQEQLQ